VLALAARHHFGGGGSSGENISSIPVFAYDAGARYVPVMTLDPCIIPVSADDPRVRDLMAVQLQFARDNTPPGSGHALAPSAVKAKGLSLWAAERRTSDTVTDTAGNDDTAPNQNADLLGFVGLSTLDAKTGEVKSLHVRPSARGLGLGQRLMAVLEREARARGMTRLVLETGSNAAYAPARRLYARLGFVPCAKFGPYVDDPFSTCMDKRLDIS